MQGYYEMELQQSRKYRKSTVGGLLAIEKREKCKNCNKCKNNCDIIR